MKKTGEPHGENHAPPPDAGVGAVRASAERFIIVDLPDNFDIDAAFKSEEDIVAEAPAVVVEPSKTPDFAGQRANHELPLHPRPSPRSLLVADLLDNRVRLEWQEAVAIAQHLCSVMVNDPAANVHHSLVEPWNVEITNAGDIQVLPGGSSSDPLVKQVGRVLVALLQDSIAPAELRLVASQASFEVPVYSSVEELSAALKRFERPGDLEAIRAAYQRGLDAKFSVAVAPVRPRPTPAVEPASEDHGRPRKAKRAPVAATPRSRSHYAPRIALVAAAVLVVAASFPLIRSAVRWLEGEDLAPAPPRVERHVEVPPSAPPVKRDIVPPPSAQNARPDTGITVHSRSADVPAPRRAEKSTPAREAVSVPPTAPARVAPSVQRRPTTSTSNEPLEAERRAAGMLAAGNPDDAAILFDAIVMKNPHYQLDPSRSTPEALAALQASKRVLLPVLARRQYQEARIAFDAGDFSYAIAAGGRALALLNSAEIGAPLADLAEEVTNLVARATAARTAEEETVYGVGDGEVTPPRPLGRQLATMAQFRKSSQPTGRLEILVGRSGRVETVRLETPANGYHDRMIVSAVKAWRYRPALRNGRPVRYNLVMTISLPEP